jgi:ABC-type multidrug transport system fused ATPase/permease subunit
LAKEIVSLKRFFEIMDSQPKIKDIAGARYILSIKGEIYFKDVVFGYDIERPIFKGLNLCIPQGKWIAIVGPSGCGKTTLISLILRLYDPDKGKITLDGIDLTQVKIKSLREKITIATQEPFLFDVSIKENITYGLRPVSQAEIDEAAQIVCIGDFIAGLPLGYDTIVGDDACRISQGLKQRIAVARAIIRQPDMLILDEATSSVDSFTEEKIFSALKKKRKEKTTIVISHRLFSIKDADRIYFLRQDGIIEEGTHQWLLSESASYRTFFENQLEGEKDGRENGIKEEFQYGNAGH